MVTSEQMEKQQERNDYKEQTREWVDSIYENIRETAGALSNTDLSPEYRDNAAKLARLPRELNVCDIRTISYARRYSAKENKYRELDDVIMGAARELVKEKLGEWGLFVLKPIPIPDEIRPSSSSYYAPEGMLYLFGEDGAAIIGEEIDHKKVRREIRRISSGKGFKGEHLRRIFVMSNIHGHPTDLLCISTFRFNQSKNLFKLVKGTEEEDGYDQFGPWYRRL